MKPTQVGIDCTQFKVGDRVISELDGQIHTILRIGPRNELCGLAGVQLIGDAVVLEDDHGNHSMAYLWEIYQEASL